MAFNSNNVGTSWLISESWLVIACSKLIETLLKGCVFRVSWSTKATPPSKLEIPFLRHFNGSQGFDNWCRSVWATLCFCKYILPTSKIGVSSSFEKYFKNIIITRGHVRQFFRFLGKQFNEEHENFPNITFGWVKECLIAYLAFITQVLRKL